MSTQETVTVHVATKKIRYNGQHFKEGDQIPVGPDALANLPVAPVEVPAEDVAFAWGELDWDWTPPAPEDKGLPEALESTLETARELLNADPEAEEAVQAVDERIQSMQDDLNERRETLSPFADAVKQARTQKQDALRSLKEARVKKELGEADASDVRDAEERYEEASGEVDQATHELEKRKPTAEARIAALESALDRLKEQRERALSVAEMSIVTGTADTAHALFNEVLNSLRNAIQAFDTVKRINAEQKERSRLGWAAKGNALLPARRYTVTMRAAAVLEEEERRLKETLRNVGLHLEEEL